MRGIIIATRHASGFNDERLTALVKVGGISVLERHARILRKTGIQDTLIVTERRSEEVQSEIDRLATLKMNLRQVWSEADGTLNLKGTFAEIDDQPWMLMDAAMIFDERLPMLLKKEFGSLAVIDDSTEAEEERRELLVDMPAANANNGEIFAGCGRLEPGAVARIHLSPDITWLGAFLSTELKETEGRLLRVKDLPDYSYDMRRHLKYIWMPVNDHNDNRRGKKMLLDWGQKRVLDWPAWYIHQPIEKAIVYHLCEYPVTPNQLTLLNNIVAFVAMGLFAIGWLIPGIILALCVGVLDGLDGKQARMKLMTSKWGQLEELLDKIYENGWYLALAYHFSTLNQGSGFPYILFWIIFGINMLEILLGLVFRFTRKVQLDDMGPFERRFRIIAGRRNTYMWTLLPFFAAAYYLSMPDLYYFGFIAIVVYSIASFVVHAWRAVHHIANKTEQRVP